MDMLDIIRSKKKNIPLSKKEIEFVIQGYVNGTIPDYQMSALLMAICFNGMNYKELLNLTIAIIDSGDVMDLSKINAVTVDKHSTGGVGDKTTLIIAPIVAALGGHVAKMSGKGLGHTGGTVDKLESIEGFRTNLSEREFFNQVKKIGVALISQTGNLTPADKKIYALRDVTATVDSIPLIASSVMSKKIAAGSDCILLDVKVGSGAFMKDIKDATELAEKMIQIGKGAGRKVVALITNMEEPLGKNIGNSLEVKEAIEILNGKGPEDLREVSIEIASYMLMMCTEKNLDEIREEVIKCIDSGKALERFKEMVRLQGGNEDYISNPELFPKAKYEDYVYADYAGYISQMDAETIGIVSGKLGAGREKKEDEIDYTAGIILNKKTGDYVEKGEILATLYSSKVSDMEELKEIFKEAIEIQKEKLDNLNKSKVLKVLK